MACPRVEPIRPRAISRSVIRETYLLPFQAAVQEAHVGSVMASYNEIDGVPNHINHWLLDKVLRQEWGFDGYLASDGDGLQMLVGTHHVAYNFADAARQGLAAGIDYDLSEGTVYSTLVEQVKQGLVPEREVDRAVVAGRGPLVMTVHVYPLPPYCRRKCNDERHMARGSNAGG